MRWEVQIQTTCANTFPKNVPFMGGLNNKKILYLMLLCFTLIVFLT